MPSLFRLNANTIYGRISRDDGKPETLQFDVFRGGERVPHNIVFLDEFTFQIALPPSLRIAEGPSIIVRFAGTDRSVPISTDLQGFVNNVNECRNGHVLGSPIFLNTFVKAQPRTIVPQRLIEHVAGTGDQDSYRSIAISTVMDMLMFGLFDQASKVVDIGCGCGRLGSVIASVLDPRAGGHYTGFDIWKDGIKWARRNVAYYYPHASFNIIGRHNAYDAHAAYKIDLPDASQDAAIATSLFTHLRAEAASKYASELGRVLRPGGKAYVTFFASKEVFRSFGDPTQTEEDSYGIYYANKIAEDTFADEDRVTEMFESNNLSVLGIKYGHWRKIELPHRDYGCGQDVFILKRKEAA